MRSSHFHVTTLIVPLLLGLCVITPSLADSREQHGHDTSACFNDADSYKIEGVLRIKMFPDPVFGSVKPYILDLPDPICVVLQDDTGSDQHRTETDVTSLQLAFPNTQLKPFVDANLNKKIAVYGQFFGSHTAHHYLPVLMSVVEATSIQQEIRGRRDPAATEETPAGVARSFYEALAQGNGDLAASAVVPEKAKSGPFSADAMTTLYGSLSDPLTIDSVLGIDSKTAQVGYHWASGKKRCETVATVHFELRNGSLLISSIDAKC